MPIKDLVLLLAKTIYATLILFSREVIRRLTFSTISLFIVLSSAPKSSRVIKGLLLWWSKYGYRNPA